MSGTTSWVVAVAGTTSAGTGNVTQLYPATCPPGVDPFTASNNDKIRRPREGALHSFQVEPDGTNGGKVQIYDIDGFSLGIDTSSTTVITNAQLVAAIAAGTARLIFEQYFAGVPGSGIINAPGIYRSFAKGLAARFVSDNSTGTMTLNLVVSGGCMIVESRGT